MTSYRKTMREVREEMLQNEAAGDLNDLKKVVAELEKASKMHLEQSKRVQAHVDMMTSAMAKNEEFELKEQPEHEIKVGGYTTKFFYMCGSAQKVMSKNADVEGAEELTRMQDDFYKLEKEVMDAGEATDEQKKQARDMYNQIMKKAGEIGLADDIDDYMKMHIDSIEKGDPKLGFGRTDMKEEKGPRQLVNPNKEIMVVKKNKVVVIDKKDKDKYMKKGWTLAEAKYDLYHKDFSSAMQHSYKMAKKLYGITVDPKEIDDKVASGPKKPSEGKTNSYRLKGDKGAIQVQVYNKGGSKPFELNMYKEEVELDEGKMSAAQIAKLKKAYEPMRGKKISMASGQKLSSIMDKVDDDKEALSQLVKADIPFVSQLAVTRLITKHGMKGAEINKLREEVAELIAGTRTVREGISVGKPHTIRKIINGREQHIDVTVTDYKKGPGQRDSVHYTYKGKKGKMPAKTFKSRMVREESMNKMRDYIVNPVQEEFELDEGAAADARRAMRGDPDMRQRAFSKDDSATDDERKAASKNIMMQMRKAVSLRSFDVEFADGKKVKIPQRVAQAVLQKYNSFRKPADKEKYQAKVGKSYKDMLAALKEGFASDAQRRAAFAQGYKAKGKKDKKESTLERMNKKIQENKNG